VSVAEAIPVFVVSVAVSLGASLVFARALDGISESLGASEGLHGILTALGADAPEISTAVAAMVASHGDVGLGVVVGSNVFNLAGLLGLSAVIAGTVAIHRHGLLFNGCVALAVTGIAVALVLGRLGAGPATAILLALLVPYVVLLSLRPGRLRRLPAWLRVSIREEVRDLEVEHVRSTTRWDVAVLVAALLAIVGSSIGMVQAATDLGSHWGVSDLVVGTLVLAALTSLPNLLTAVRLALHGRGAAVVSEALNSNSLNVLFGIAIPGILLSFGAVSGVERFSAWFLLGLTVVAIALAYRGGGLARPEGALVALLYVPFVVVIATR
jgi:cation:H+ antiporter